MQNLKIGVSTFAWTACFDKTHLFLFDWVGKLGISCLEVPMFDPGKLPLADIRSASSQAGVEISVCAILPTGVNPLSQDAAVRKSSIEHLRCCVQATSQMGGKILGGPVLAPIGYLPSHRPSEQEFHWACEAIEGLLPYLDENDVRLSIEPVNRAETFFLRTAAEANRICDRIGHPKVGVTLDTFHANIEEANMPNAIRDLGKRLFHVHLSENHRGILGTGHVPFKAVLSALQEVGYEGLLMIEGFGYLEHESTAPGYLWADRKIDPQMLLQQSLQYLGEISV